MLDTNLKHLNTAKELQDLIHSQENVMVCCGRMGPMCIPVYGIMEDLEPVYPHVAFRDMPFDSPEAHIIKTLPECRNFRGLPFTVYYKNGQVAAATASIQTREQVTEILNRVFEKA